MPVTFTLNYKTDYGQIVALVGNHAKLGSWSDFKWMKWNDGNLWKLTVDVPENESVNYKYVIIDYVTKKALRWEEGINRICDPRFLRVHEFYKTRQLIDEWEHFTVNFSIYYPGQSADEVMRINGDTHKLGFWNKGEGALVMSRGNPRIWLTGATVEPWEFANVRFSPQTLPTPPRCLTYKYSLWNEKEDYVVWEREPSRYMDL